MGPQLVGPVAVAVSSGSRVGGRLKPKTFASGVWLDYPTLLTCGSLLDTVQVYCMGATGSSFYMTEGASSFQEETPCYCCTAPPRMEMRCSIKGLISSKIIWGSKFRGNKPFLQLGMRCLVGLVVSRVGLPSFDRLMLVFP